MKPSARALLLGTEELTVEWGGVAVVIQAQPRAYTGKLEKQVRAAPSNTDGLTLIVSRLVKSWDLTVDDGPDAEPYPITEEALAELPVAFLSAVAEALTGVLNPNSPRKSENSSGA